MLPQTPSGFQAPEPYVPESAKAAGALYEAGVAPSIIGTMTNESAPFDPVAYRNQFKQDGSGLAGIAETEPLQAAVHPGQKDLINNASSGGQQMPNFYQQPMGMMMPFGMGGFNPMSMFMNPYGGGLGGMAYNFMNIPMPLYGQGSQFTAGQYQAPEPIKNPMVNAANSFIGGFGFY